MMEKPDYSRLIDDEIHAFIARTEACYPAGTAGFSIAEQRRIYDAMCLVFHRPHPPGISHSDSDIAGVRCRIYHSLSPTDVAVTVIYLHGGGHVVGGLESHDDVCAELCNATGLKVISVDYRLSPENLHPAALRDVLAVIGAVPGRLVLVGDSAGGNLAAAASHALRDSRILGQVLIYPGLGGDPTRGSYIYHADAPMLTLKDLEFYAGVRTGGRTPPPGDPTLSPLQDHDFSGLPMTFATAAECDPLADDAADYAERITAAGGLAHAATDQGLVHGWLRARHQSRRAAAGFERICDVTARFAGGEWPF